MTSWQNDNDILNKTRRVNFNFIERNYRQKMCGFLTSVLNTLPFRATLCHESVMHVQIVCHSPKMKKVHFYILHFYKIIDFLMRIRSIKKLQLKYYVFLKKRSSCKKRFSCKNVKCKNVKMRFLRYCLSELKRLSEVVIE